MLTPQIFGIEALTHSAYKMQMTVVLNITGLIGLNFMSSSLAHKEENMEQTINKELSDNDGYENIYVVVFENESGRGMTVVNFATQKYLDEFTHNSSWLKILREDLPDQRFIEAWQFNETNDAIVVNTVWLQELLVAEVEREQSHRIWLVQDEFTALQTDLMLGIIDDEGTARLLVLKKYVVALKQLDLSTAPDIEWPVAPLS